MAAMNTDTRGVLGSVQAPTLVIGQSGSLLQGQRRYIADHVPDVRLVEGPVRLQLPFIDSGPILDAIEEFLTGHAAAPEPDRVLATVLFTDLVASTRSGCRDGRPSMAESARQRTTLSCAPSWIASEAVRSSQPAMECLPRSMDPAVESIACGARRDACRAHWSRGTGRSTHRRDRVARRRHRKGGLQLSLASGSRRTPERETCLCREPWQT